MMIDLSVFLRGLLIGFSIAAPVGPIGVLCIRRTLSEGRLAGFLSGMGAASADMFYGAVAAFGLTAVQDLLIGGVQLAAYRWGHLLTVPGSQNLFHQTIGAGLNFNSRGVIGRIPDHLHPDHHQPDHHPVIYCHLRRAAPQGETDGNYLSASVMVLGVFLGSAAWWLTLSTGVSFLREKFTPSLLNWVNRLAGVIIFGFGIAVFTIK